jgi:hypothetical protein
LYNLERHFAPHSALFNKLSLEEKQNKLIENLSFYKNNSKRSIKNPENSQKLDKLGRIRASFKVAHNLAARA